jgi:tRNA(Ser,Leu) C12 N-acetylase TAN1
MQVFTMVVLIVAISCGTAVVIEFLKNRRLALKQAPVHDEVLARLDSLSERIAVLEEIVTDDGYHLNRELERLERRA